MKLNINHVFKITAQGFASGMLLLGFSFQVTAQVQNLHQVLEQSKQNFPSIKAKQAEVNSATRKVSANKTDYLPTVLLNTQYSLSSNNNMTGSFYPNDAIGISTTGAALPEDVYRGVYSNLTSLAIDWKVFSFGKVQAGVGVAKQNQQISQADYDNELFQHQVRVIDLYLNALAAQKLVRVQETNLQRAKSVKDIVRSGARSGIRAGVDSMMANAEYARALMQLSESKSQARVANLRLSEVSGIYNKDLVADTMAFFHQTPFDSSKTTVSLHPRLKLYRSQIDASIAKSRLAKLNYLPSFSLVASGLARGSGNSRTTGQTSYDLASGASYNLYNYLLGVSFRWNITGLARIKSDYNSEKYLSDKYQYLYEEQELALKRQAGEADAQMELAKEQAQLVPLELEAARNAYNQAKARYESGLSDILSLNQNYYFLNRAEAGYYISMHNLWKALLIKSATSGDLSVFLNQCKKGFGD